MRPRTGGRAEGADMARGKPAGVARERRTEKVDESWVCCRNTFRAQGRGEGVRNGCRRPKHILFDLR